MCGSISDKELTKNCGLLNLLDSGDGVMADKGFVIHDLLEPLGCHLVIPAFLKKKKQFSREESRTNKQISNVRVHVERAIKRFKEYHIFNAVVPLTLCGSINQLWSVCCMLSNFKEPLY